MNDEAAQRAYWALASLLLLSAGTRTGEGLSRLASNWNDHHPITRSFLLLLIPDVIIITFYGPHHVISLVNNSFLEHGWCEIVAFMGVSSVAAANIGSLGIAFISKKALTITSANRTICLSPAFLSKVIVTSWVFAFLFAILLASYGKLGSYRNIYCGIRDPSNIIITIPWILFVLSCGVYIWWTYQVIRVENPTNDTQGLSAIKNHGYRMCFIYFTAWSLTTFLAFLSIFIGLNYSIWLDIVAAWTLKSGPILNSIVFLRAINATEANLLFQKGLEEKATHTYAVVPSSSSQSSSQSQLTSSEHSPQQAQEQLEKQPATRKQRHKHRHKHHKPRHYDKKERKGHSRHHGQGMEPLAEGPEEESKNFPEPPLRIISTTNPWPGLMSPGGQGPTTDFRTGSLELATFRTESLDQRKKSNDSKGSKGSNNGGDSGVK